MARIRSIHPGLFTDEAFMSASAESRLLIIGLWTEADDQGVFEWKPITIKARIFPADVTDVRRCLDELTELGFIRTFSDDGKSYGAIRNFRKWQRPKKPTVAFPLPTDLVAYVGLDESDEDAEQTLRRRKYDDQNGRCAYCFTGITYYSKRHESLEIDHVIPKCRGGSDDEDNLVASCRTCNRSKGSMTGDEFRVWLRKRVAGANPPTGSPKIPTESAKEVFAPLMEDVGGRMKGEDEKSSLRSDKNARDARFSAADLRAEFEGEFWPAWPNKTGKPVAFKSFAKVRKAHDLGVILAGVRRYIDAKPPDRAWLNPTTFLNQERFLDQPAAIIAGRGGGGSSAPVLDFRPSHKQFNKPTLSLEEQLERSRAFHEKQQQGLL